MEGEIVAALMIWKEMEGRFLAELSKLVIYHTKNRLIQFKLTVSYTFLTKETPLLMPH